MKNFIRQSLLNSFSLFIVASVLPGLVIPNSLLSLLWTGIIFTLINHLLKPIIKLFLLPVNLVTLGLFGWVANVFVLLIATKIVADLSIISFTSKALNYSGFTIPSLTFSYLLALISASFLLSLSFNFLNNFLVDSD